MFLPVRASSSASPSATIRPRLPLSAAGCEWWRAPRTAEARRRRRWWRRLGAGAGHRRLAARPPARLQSASEGASRATPAAAARRHRRRRCRIRLRPRLRLRPLPRLRPRAICAPSRRARRKTPGSPSRRCRLLQRPCWARLGVERQERSDVGTGARPLKHQLKEANQRCGSSGIGGEPPRAKRAKVARAP